MKKSALLAALIILSGCATPTPQGTPTPWLSDSKYHQVWVQKRDQKQYTSRIEGRVTGTSEAYRAIYSPYGEAPFRMASFHGISEKTYRKYNKMLKSVGFKRITFQKFYGLDGEERIQVAWIKDRKGFQKDPRCVDLKTGEIFEINVD